MLAYIPYTTERPMGKVQGEMKRLGGNEGMCIGCELYFQKLWDKLSKVLKEGYYHKMWWCV